VARILKPAWLPALVPIAIGTQTSGSTIKPASYCGITGFKPTYGLLPLSGCLQYAKSLDTLGFFTHTPADMLLLWEAMGHPTGREQDFAFGVPEPMLQVDPKMASTVQHAVASLRKAGLTCKPVNISAMHAELVGAQRIVAFYEGARFHKQRFAEFGDRLGYLAGLVREGLRISEVRYEEARRVIGENRRRFQELYVATPVILVPSATGPAPLGLASTGDSKMNTPSLGATTSSTVHRAVHDRTCPIKSSEATIRVQRFSFHCQTATGVA
jgi:Asp-tRNA(Asn)/Glu-tRNA(Gln) amidotransferase A subunit family amidase